MSPVQTDQRKTRRFNLALPVSVRFEGGEPRDLTAESRDVSSRGIYFFVESKLNEGSDIEFTLTLPPEITLTQSIRVRCKGKVLRIQPDAAANKIGVAALIEKYDFVGES